MEITTTGYAPIDHERYAEKLAKETPMSKREWEVYLLRNGADLSVEETAEEIGISTGSVSTYSKRYRLKLDEAKKLVKITENYENINSIS